MVSVNQDVANLKLSYMADGNINGAATLEQIGGSSKS
jgi:hypothetical protein